MVLKKPYVTQGIKDLNSQEVIKEMSLRYYEKLHIYQNPSLNSIPTNSVRTKKFKREVALRLSQLTR